MEPKPERTIRILPRLAVIIGTLAVVMTIACKKAPEGREPEQANAEQQRIKRAIKELADAHKAVVNWRQAFAAKGPVGRIYSAEMASALIRNDGRPLLFIADVVDVGSTGVSNICAFQTDANLSWKLKLVLDCTTDQADQIMHGSAGKYAVAARISSIGSAELSPGEGDPETQQGKFSASGKCLGMVFVGKKYFDDFLEILSFPDHGD